MPAVTPIASVMPTLMGDAKTYADSSSTGGVVFYGPNYANVTFTGATTNQPIRFGSVSKIIWNSTSTASGATHFGGGINWVVVQGSGNPNFVLAGEDKVEVSRAGTVSIVKGHETQLASNVSGSTLTFYAGNTSQILDNAGTITTAVLHDSDVASNNGTITTLIDYWCRDVSARSGIGTKYGFRNDDAGKQNASASGWLDQSVQYASPTTGSTVNMTSNWLILWHGSTIATLTVALPAAANIPQGRCFDISTNQEVTALTVSCSGASFVMWVGDTLAAGQTVHFRWDAANGMLRMVGTW